MVVQLQMVDASIRQSAFARMSVELRQLFRAVAIALTITSCARTERIIADQFAPEGGVGGAGAGVAGAGAGVAGVGVGVGVTKDSEVILSDAGLTTVALGGYLNGESFQQDGIVSYQAYQYAAFWNSGRHVVLARRALPLGAWSSIEFTDYLNTQTAVEDTISIGICAADGTIHLSFDNLPFNNIGVAELHYRKSVLGLASSTAPAAWSVASFSDVTNELVTGTSIARLGVPRFVSEPGGDLLFEASIKGSSGGTDETLWEYNGQAHSWTLLGRFIAGVADGVAAYIHGFAYTRNGGRLHVSWCWREASGASSNHDLLYASSDNEGRTWQDSSGAVVATSGAAPLTKNSAGIKVWTISQNRGLMNQEHMTVDAAGQVHVLLSHLPDAEGDDSNFDSARAKSQFFHYLRDTKGHWTRNALQIDVVANFRGKLAISASGNAYAVLPDLRIAAASAASLYTDWTLIDAADSGRFFSDPLIDTARLVSEDGLTVFYPQKGSPNLYVLDYSLR